MNTQNNVHEFSGEESFDNKQKITLLWPVLLTFLVSAVVFGFVVIFSEINE